MSRIFIEHMKDRFIHVRIDDEDDFVIKLTNEESVEPTLMRKRVLEVHKARQALRSSLHSTVHLFDKLLVEEERQPSPPAVAEALMQLLGPKRSINAQLGDLQEMFNTDILRFGDRRARRRYWLQVIRSITPFVVQKFKRLSFIGIIIDYGRTKLGL
jgi:hypothetical protein